MGVGSRLRRGAAGVAIAFACLAEGNLVYAQQASDGKPEQQPDTSSANGSLFGQEIVVTAQKREESAQRVGVSITAFSGKNLEALGVRSTRDLANLIPAVNIQSAGGTDLQLVVNIRGVSQNDFGDHNEPPVAIYVDEGYVSWLGAVGMASYDLERVEALRGPQGTLFGRNATGGLIHFISRKPKSSFDGYASATYSSHDSYHFEGAVGGGIAQGVAVRLAAAYDRSGNYVKNFAGPDLGNARNFDVRLQTLIEPAANLSILLKANYSKLTGGGSLWTHRAAAADPANYGLGRFLGSNENFYNTCPGCDALGYRNQHGNLDSVDLNDPAYINRDVWSGQGKLEYHLGAVTLTSISDYRTVKRFYADDADGGPFTLTAYQQNINSGKQFSQELRLSGTTAALKWVAGFYYLDITGRYSSNINIDPTFVNAGTVGFDFINNKWNLKTRSDAYFGQIDYALNDKLTLVGGFRWTNDRKSFAYANTDSLGGGVLGGGLVFNAATVGDLARRSEGGYSFKAQAEYRPTSDAFLYAGVTRGIKAGGFTASLDGLIGVNEVNYKPEVLTNYEAGFKTSWLGGKLRVNGSGFYYDYKDYQAFLFQGFTSKIINVNAEVYGGELELTANPATGLDVVAGLSWLHAKAFDVPMPNGARADRTLPQSPRLSLNALVRQSIPLGGFGSLAVQADASYRSSYNFNIVGHETTAVGANTIVNGRITYTPDSKRYSVAVFVDNLFDERYPVSAFDISAPAFGGASLRAFNRPRWIGVQARVDFK